MIKIAQLISLLILGTVMMAQEVNKGVDSDIKTNMLREEIALFTDRSIYAVGEDIFVQAQYSKDISSDRIFSKVLYVELIQPDGTPVIQTKSQILDNVANGKVKVPANLLSGIYYLKAYTRWMRNYPTDAYAYLQIKVINPSNPVLSHSQGSSSDTLKFHSLTEDSDLEIQIGKESYKPREAISVELTNTVKSRIDDHYCISVVKEGAKTIGNSNIYKSFSMPKESELAYYLPDIYGLALSGRILDDDHQAVGMANVSLVLLSSTPVLENTSTDTNGYFSIQVPNLCNEDEYFINAEKDSLNLTIEIDLDFCDRLVNLPDIAFSLSDEEKEIANDICINAQLNNLYRNIEINQSKEDRDISFFGQPDKVFHTQDYIDLVNLRDFIHELVPEIKNVKGKLTPFSNRGHVNSLASLPYLMMIDNVPISNQDNFLNIKVNKIERIELIKSGYVVGDMAYCGVISVFSKKHDMAGVELPKNGMFFKCTSIESLLSTIGTTPIAKNIPDRRNCLYWNPNVILGKESSGRIEFYASDVSGKYQIIVQSSSKDNKKALIKTISFNVE